MQVIPSAYVISLVQWHTVQYFSSPYFRDTEVQYTVSPRVPLQSSQLEHSCFSITRICVSWFTHKHTFERVCNKDNITDKYWKQNKNFIALDKEVHFCPIILNSSMHHKVISWTQTTVIVLYTSNVKVRLWSSCSTALFAGNIWSSSWVHLGAIALYRALLFIWFHSLHLIGGCSPQTPATYCLDYMFQSYTIQ